MSRVFNTTASGAVIALIATLGIAAPGVASAKMMTHHAKHGHMRMSRAHRGPAMAMAAPAPKYNGNGDFFGSGGLFGGVNGTGQTGGGAIDPANASATNLLGGGGLLGTGIAGGNGVLGTGVLSGQGALGVGILGL